MIRTAPVTTSQPSVKSDSALLYLGAIVPNDPTYWNEATSRAGNLFQTNMLNALRGTRLEPTEILSYRPEPSYPKGPLLTFTGSAEVDGHAVRYLPMFNYSAFKIITLGMSAALGVIKWAWRQRSTKQRIVLSYNLNCPPAWPILWACRLTRSKFVAFIGDIYVPGEVIAGGWMREVEFAMQRDAVSRLDGLLVANWAIRDDFAPERKSMLVEGGVPASFLQRFAAIPKRDGPLRIVFAGSLTRLNGLDLLAEAMKINQDADIALTIAGGGPLADLAREMAAHDKRVTYAGEMPHSDVLKLYKDAHVVLNLRRTDNRTQRYVFPSKVVECLATGRLLLTTQTGHVAEEFGEITHPLAEETPEALSTALHELAVMPEPERVRLGQKAQRYVGDHKTWEAHALRLQAYLTEVLN